MRGVAAVPVGGAAALSCPEAALAQAIGERVKKVIVEQLGAKQAEAVNSSSLVDDLGADEEDMVGLVIALEGEFDTEISEEEAAKLTGAQAAVDLMTGSRP
jgi:acyl carrier protein